MATLKDLLQALQINGKAIASELAQIIKETPTITSAFQGVISGEATEQQIDDAIALYNEHTSVLAKIHDTVLRSTPGFESPATPTTPPLPPAEPKATSIGNLEQISILGSADIGLPGTLDIGFKQS